MAADLHLHSPAVARSAVLARAVAEPGARAGDGWQTEGHDGFDRLHNLGRAQNYNINVDHGAFFAVVQILLATTTSKHASCAFKPAPFANPILCG